MKVLVVEDCLADFQLIERTLRAHDAAWTCRRVASLAETEAALAEGGWTIALADYRLPGVGFEQLQALFRSGATALPLVVVSGSLPEEEAVALFRGGVADFVHKDRLYRLPGAVARSIAAEAERAARTSAERQLAAVAQSVPGVIFALRLAPDGAVSFPYVSPMAQSLGGIGAEEITADAEQAFLRIHPEDRTRILASMQRGAKDLGSWHDEFRFRHPTRGERWIEGRSTPTREPDGAVVWHGFVADITERKQADLALRWNEERFRRLFNQVTQLAVQGYAPDGTVRFWNKASEELYGYTSEEAVGRNLADLIIPPEMREAVRGAMRQMAETGVAIPGAEITLMRKDGSRVPVFSNHTMIEITGVGRELYCIDIDLTERRRVEEALRLTAAALQDAANAIVITDREGIIQWVNPAFCSSTGYGAAEAIGRKPSILKSGRHPPEFYREMWRTILAGQAWRGEIINRRRDGQLFTDDMTVTPLRNDQNEITHFIAIKQDITERRKFEAHLLRHQRLESVGRLASGVAHDLNNILSPVLLAPQLLRELVPDPAAAELLDTIEASARRGAEIVRQLLVFSRGLPAERAPVRMQSIVSEMARIIRETFPRNIVLQTSASGAVPPVMGAPTQLHQVLMNLCVNARDAMPSGGRLSIDLECEEVGAERIAAHPGAAPGAYVALTVSDTGIGIPHEVVDKIFDPFFTTKPLGEGTGLGLSTALGIVRSHHGFIEVGSQAGHGSQFRVLLPAADAAAGAGVEAARVAPPPDGRGQGVLLVDDEAALRSVLRQTLERHGYHVLEARHGAEALAIFDANATRLHVVLTDIMMPVMDGAALVRELRHRNTLARIVVMTGQPAIPEWLQAGSSGVRAILHKPIAPDTLLHTLHDVLSGA